MRLLRKKPRLRIGIKRSIHMYPRLIANEDTPESQRIFRRTVGVKFALVNVGINAMLPNKQS
jgi:hypothetical protein